MTKIVGASNFARMLDQKRHENLETDTDLTTKEGIWREPNLVDRGKPITWGKKNTKIFLEFWVKKARKLGIRTECKNA